ncbi:MAG: hypothetical protein MJD61_16960 [Proteobacteria bacterium]|nr:hypothetical protein [Pseudomonadota bacterium]
MVGLSLMAGACAAPSEDRGGASLPAEGVSVHVQELQRSLVANAGSHAIQGIRARRRLRPVLTCVDKLARGRFVAHWGYENTTRRVIGVRKGRRNRLGPGRPDQGQPIRFRPGLHEDVFTTEFSRRQAWRLNRAKAVATRRSPRCRFRQYSSGHADLAMQLSPTPGGGFEVFLEAEGATIDGVPGTDGLFDIENVMIVTDATFTRPDAGRDFFAPLCVDEGENAFWLPQGNSEAAAHGAPFMGLALEADAGVLVDDQVRLKLVAVTSPSGEGHYSVWKDGFPPVFGMTSCDGIDAADELLLPLGHDHFNMGLSGEPGDWLVTYEVRGDLAAGGSASEQFSVRYRTVSNPLRGNIRADALPSNGSVGFIVTDQGYELFRRPGWNSTSINFVDSERRYAYGWSRDKHYSDPTATTQSWRLDLATRTFETLEIPGAIWSVMRGGREDGTVVGKLKHDNGTPNDTTDDVRYGFIHSWQNGETTLVAREGFDDIGFTDINDEGVVVGFNDFGTLGFIYRNGAFEDLTAPGAFRLFPFQISDEGTIVGFMGLAPDSWYFNQINPGFTAQLTGDGYTVTRYQIAGASGTGLTALNERGDLGGVYYPQETSIPIPFRVAEGASAPEFFPFQAGPFEPFVTGMTEDGLLHGEIYILDEPQVCGGHGSLEGNVCVCDAGYEVDPVDPENCIELNAECSGHGHLHGDVCHCDSGFVPDPNDKGACVPG